MQGHILRLAKNSLLYGSGQVLTRFISLLLLPVFTAYLTPADYGVASILGVLTFFLAPLAGLGIGTALGIVYFEGDHPRRKQATIWSAFVVLAASGALLVGVGVALGPQLASLLFSGEGYDYPYLIVVSLATSALGILAQPLMVYLQLEERVKTFVSITVSSTLLTIGLSLLMIIGLHRGVSGYLEAALVGQAITLLLALIAPAIRLPFRLSREIAGLLIRLGLPLVPAFLFIFLMQQVNKVFIQAELGLDAVGIYTIGYNMGLFLALIVGGFTNAWYPFFMAFIDRPLEAAPLFGRIFSYYLLSFGTLSLLFYIAARPAVLILTQPPFHGAYVAVGPSATVQFLIGAHTILLAGMYFAKEVKFQTLVQGLSAAISIALNLALIPVLGITGAAIALAAGFAAMDIIQHLWNRYRGYLDVGYDRGRVRSFFAIYLGFASTFLWPRDLSLIGEVIFSAFGCVLLAACVYALLSVPERQELWTLVRRFEPATAARRIGR